MFIPFYFESNSCWGFVKDYDDWVKMCEIFTQYYIDPQQIYNARVNEHRNSVGSNDYEAFGFYNEYSGDVTLKEFFIEHNMQMF